MKRILTNGPALITSGICVLLVLPQLVMDGMFMDAVMYSAVGRNLAEGTGTFWFPFFTEAHMQTATFHENPPLGYGFMAMFYRIFGSGIHTERIFIGTSFLISAVLIVKFWRMLWPTHYKMAWLPVLLWVIVPVVHWSFQNNMMENVMGIFILGSAMASYRAFRADQRHLYWAIWAALLAVGAFLVKGLPGLFVWATPVALAIAQRRQYGRAIAHTITYAVVFAAACLLMYLYTPARESLDIYLFERTANRIAEGSTTSSPFSILRQLAENLAIPGIVTLIVGLIAQRVNSERMQWDSVIGFLTFMGIAGSLPFMATLVQRGFYLVPVIPFFALAFASVLRPVIEKSTSKWRKKAVLQIVGWVVIGLGILISAYTTGMDKRDHEMLEDVRFLRDNMREEVSVFYTNTELNTTWSFKAYLERYAKIGLSDRGSVTEYDYALLPKGTSFENAEKLSISADLETVDVWSIAK